VRHLGDRLDALVDDLLAPRQRDRLVAHAAHCGRCGEELALHRRVKERLERAAAPELPGDLADRLRSIAEENSPTVRPGLSSRRSAHAYQDLPGQRGGDQPAGSPAVLDLIPDR
jgi:anti-sigma factor RsiW